MILSLDLEGLKNINTIHFCKTSRCLVPSLLKCAIARCPAAPSHTATLAFIGIRPGTAENCQESHNSLSAARLADVDLVKLSVDGLLFTESAPRPIQSSSRVVRLYVHDVAKHPLTGVVEASVQRK